METAATEEDREGEGFDFRLDPNRIRTDAEIQLFADVFKISKTEAISILSNRTNHFLSKVSPLDRRGDSKSKAKG